MAEFISMQLSNNSFQELFGNKARYLVPRFQRDYAWEQENWEDLWDDIEALDTEAPHYLGYVVLQRKEDGVFEIIDGQQRMTTLSVLVMAALHQIQKLIDAGREVGNNTQRMEVIKNRFLVFRYSVTLIVKNKLQLNRNNAVYFRDMISNLKPTNDLHMLASNRLIRKAFEFFAAKPMGKSGEAIAQKIEDITRNMIFTKILVQDDINAYKVFETLNARGVQLSTPNLLKSYMLSVIAKSDRLSDDDLSDLDEEWSKIIAALGENSFTDFARYHYNFQHPLSTSRGLFSAIKKQVSDSASGVAYLNSMSEFAPIYSALLQPDDNWWANRSAEYKDGIRYLHGISTFGIKQPLVILMIAFARFSETEFVKTAKYLYILSMRYNAICHFSTKDQERIYNQIAIKVHNGTYKRASHIKNDKQLFGKLYPDDAQLQSAFTTLRMPSTQSSKKIRFLLSEIEKSLGNSSIDPERTVLEHVCPKPNDHWQEYFGDGVNDIRDRIGNMILLQKDDLGSEPFESKKQTYRASPFKLAQRVASYEKWNMNAVNGYQEWLGKQAANAFSVD